MSQNKDYLGDGVYADYDGYAVTLTTEDGIRTTNEIYLEPSLLVALGRYCDRMKVFDSKPAAASPRERAMAKAALPIVEKLLRDAEGEAEAERECIIEPHTYVLNDKGTNACKECGLDLAHPIHRSKP